MRLLAAACAAAALAGCAAPRQRVLAPSPERLGEVRRVAVMPFFHDASLGADDPAYEGPYAEAFVSVHVREGLRGHPRLQLLPSEEVSAALRRRGFKGIEAKDGGAPSLLKAMKDPAFYRAGMTVQQALEAGRELGADAVLLGSFGTTGLGLFGMRAALAVRLLDPRTGELLWGGARSESYLPSVFRPIRSQGRLIRRLAERLAEGLP